MRFDSHATYGVLINLFECFALTEELRPVFLNYCGKLRDRKSALKSPSAARTVADSRNWISHLGVPNIAFTVSAMTGWL